MKLNKVLCLILMLTVVFTLASCGVVGGWFGGETDETTEYTVTFDSDGGSAVPSQTVEAGKTATEPTAPTKDGYTFAGWYNGATAWDFDNAVNEDVTLKAKWDAVPTCNKHVDSNKDGKCDNCGADVEVPPSVITYNINYYDGSTKLDLEPKTYNANSTDLALPEAPAKDHYTFVGWFTDKALTKPATEINVNANSNLSFYASYAPVSYTVTYQLDGGVNAETNPATYTVEDLLGALADPTKEDYNFLGWYLDANCTTPYTGISADMVGDITVYAKWKEAPKPHTITFLDHEGNVIESKIFYEHEGYTIKEKYTSGDLVFIGWYIGDEFTGDTVDYIPAGTTTDVVVKAHVTDPHTAHKINYYIDGKKANTGYFEEGYGLATLATAAKNGYEFSGWYANGEFTGDLVTSIPAGTTEDVNLYGYYTAITYTVKFFDGTTELSFDLTSYEISGSAIALPAVPEKFGHIVAGWYDENGTKYTDIPANSTGNLVLYATYTLQSYSVTYYLNGGENNSGNVATYEYGTIPTLHDPLSRDGYLFAGWFTTATFETGTEIVDLSDCAYQNVILYAKWTPVANNGSDSTTTPEVPF